MTTDHTTTTALALAAIVVYALVLVELAVQL